MLLRWKSPFVRCLAIFLFALTLGTKPLFGYLPIINKTSDSIVSCNGYCTIKEDSDRAVNIVPGEQYNDSFIVDSNILFECFRSYRVAREEDAFEKRFKDGMTFTNMKGTRVHVSFEALKKLIKKQENGMEVLVVEASMFNG